MPAISIYFFDMDHTLVDNDCDVSWKTFLIEEGLASPDCQRQADHFFEQYVAGRLDIDAFLAFQLAEFQGRTPAQMAELVRRHFERFVKPALYPEAKAVVRQALASGRPVALLTATNTVVARPLATFLSIPILLGTELELQGGAYTGRICGQYCGGEGKRIVAEAFCRRNGHPLAQASYYGDSISDAPLLTAVGAPVVVNPGEQLYRLAVQQGWPIRRFGRSP
jgi:HAD superfamily hydrolase (TIGR01490 family)